MLCRCTPNQVVEIVGLCDGSNLDLSYGAWTEISIPEVFSIPEQKPDIETINRVFENVKIVSKRLINTPNSGGADNAEGTRLTGRKLVIEGLLNQKIVYTADELTQPVHSAHFCIPFSAFIVVDPNATDANQFCIDVCVEDVFVRAVDTRRVFKNVTLLLNARRLPTIPC